MSVERIEVPATPEVFAEWHSRFSVASKSDEGKTFAELQVAWKCGERMVRKYLQDAKKAGILRQGFRESTNLAGKRCQTPVYSFIIPKGKR